MNCSLNVILIVDCCLFSIETACSFYFTNVINLVSAQTEYNTPLSDKIITNETWLSKRDNLNITTELDPKVPIIDEWAKIQFEVRKLDSSELVNGNLTTNATLTDLDGRLFKFPEQVIADGKFSVDYILPDDGQHKIMLQLYKDSTAFTIASFDLTIPHPKASSNDLLSWLFQPRPY